MDSEHDPQLLADRPDLVEVALDTAEVGVWTLQCSTEEMAWSPLVDRLFGHGLGERAATVESYVQQLHPDDRKRFQYQLEQVRETG